MLVHSIVHDLIRSGGSDLLWRHFRYTFPDACGQPSRPSSTAMLPASYVFLPAIYLLLLYACAPTCRLLNAGCKSIILRRILHERRTIHYIIYHQSLWFSSINNSSAELLRAVSYSPTSTSSSISESTSWHSSSLPQCLSALRPQRAETLA